MSIGIPQPPGLETVRSQVIELLAGISGRTGKAGTSGPPAPSVMTDSLPTDLLPQIPASVLRVLVELAEGGIPLYILDVKDGDSRGTHADVYAVVKDTSGPKAQVVSGLLRAVDSGAIRAEEFNAFLALFAVPVEVVRDALAQVGHNPDTERVTLNDALYRLVSGRLVTASARSGENASRFWLNTAAVTAALLLLAAALIRFS